MTPRFHMETLARPDQDGHRYVFHLLGDDETDYQYRDLLVVRAWCIARFGEAVDLPVGDPENVGSRWVGSVRYYFRDEVDAFEFKMRWC